MVFGKLRLSLSGTKMTKPDFREREIGNFAKKKKKKK